MKFPSLAAAVLALFAATSLGSLSCRRYPFIFQPASAVQGQTKEQFVDQPSQSDILFVIDNSGSMATKQANLIRNFASFINVLAKSDTQFQIGITTTDYNCSEVPDPANPHDGKCGRLFSPNNKSPIIRRKDYADNDALIARFNEIVAAVGIKGSPYEQGLKAAARAVSPDLIAPNAPNEGFVRPDALLVVALLTDESDCSYSFDPQLGYAQFVNNSLDVGLSCYLYKDRLVPVNTWTQSILNVKKGLQSLVSVGVISSAVISKDGAVSDSECSEDTATKQPTNNCYCFKNQPLSYCAFTKNPPIGEFSSICAGDNCCTSLANDRYSQFADSYKTHLKASICQTEYNETLRQLGQISINNCFQLDPPPVGDDPTNIQISRKKSGETAFTVASLISSDDAKADKDGWYYLIDVATSGQKVHEACLSGNFKRQLGDTFRVFVLNSTLGVNSDIAAP